MSRPHVWAAVREEVDRVCGPNAQPTWEQLKQLKVCEAVLQESMRLYTPVSTITRETIDTVTITGKGLPDVVIPPNTIITIDLAVIHRDEQFWGPTASQFDHTRWMGETRPTANSPYMHVPFSAGSRNCIGQNFANLETKIILAMICQSVDLSLAPGLEMVSEDQAAHNLAATMKPKNGMNVYVKPRVSV
ncbi:hypothetical protein HDU85_007825 [Gaertneriomyces sp. JEL0708]|nr:hypothetical protein HDU85_007825 [Gaertneriomyces sp. JEL0708]